MERMDTNPTKYVVFDVETNGLKSKKDDLLSISFYKPDDGKEYSKFLPLELNRKIVTTHINGITEKDLANATALTQAEFDCIMQDFELEKRTILIYAGKNFDASFLSEYLKRHHILGFDKLNFFNFKRNIISSRYSQGNITKDKLCALFKIDGVEAVHSGSNDCKLEWELFKKMDGYFYLVTEGGSEDNVFRLNADYIVPASLLSSHPNLSRVLCERPYIECQSTLVKSFEIDAKGIEKFPTNLTGKEDKELEKRINSTSKNLKERIRPLVEYIKYEIFNNEHILSQELVVDYENNILALCDLSTKKTILEIKTNCSDSLAYKEQFFYEAKGRDIYHLKMEWIKDWNTNLLKKIIFHISFVDTHIGTPGSSNWTEGKRAEKRAKKIAEIQKYLSPSDLSLVSFINTNSPIKLQCKICEHEWNIRYATLMKKIPDCPKCKHKIVDKKKTTISKEDRIKLRAENYYEKILQKSNHTIVAINYTGSKDNVDAICVACGYKWKIRADHLVNRCWCPICKKKKDN